MTQEEKTHSEKVDFYDNKIKFTENRISILKNCLGVLESTRETDCTRDLLANSYELEILTLEASLENLQHYWDHYTKRLKAIQEREQLITEECNKYFSDYLDRIMQIPSEKINALTPEWQNYYNRFCSLQSFESQEEKNDAFVLMKEFLYQLTNNLIPNKT